MTVKTLDVTLPAEIFDVQTNVPLIHQVVVAQLAAARQGTHSTKTRGEVRGGGRKPYKQKGTGRARQGSTRAPQFAGGGVVHGPQPRDYSQRTPKKMKAAALRGALSDRARHGRVHVVASLVTGATPSAKEAAGLFAGLSERKNLLVVLDRSDIVSLKSVRNLPDVHVLAVDQLNTYDVLCADDVVFTQAALDTFVAGPVKGSHVVSFATASGDEGLVLVEDNHGRAKATGVTQDAPAKAEKPAAAVKSAAAVKPPKADKPAKADQPATLVEGAETGVAETETELPAGAVAALADGSAPEGYTVKGNADSGLYHEPEGRWYDATVAELWFASAEDAEQAGFTKAGSKNKAQEDDK